MGCICSKAEPVPESLRSLCGVWAGSAIVEDGASCKDIQFRLLEDGTGSFVYVRKSDHSKSQIVSNCAKFSNYTETGFTCNSGCGTFEVQLTKLEDGRLAPRVEGVSMAPTSTIIVPQSTRMKHSNYRSGMARY